MVRKRKATNKYIPESLGNTINGVLPHAVALSLNAAIHMTIFVVYGAPVQQLWRFVLSFFFFIYPFSYVTDILWSLRPSVRGVLSGEILINRLHYMNAARREVEASQLLPVTVSIPVYLEENEVIFETVRQSLAAVASYREYSSREANVLVSEDGLAPLMGGKCGKEEVDSLLEAFRNAARPRFASVESFAPLMRIDPCHAFDGAVLAFEFGRTRGEAGLFGDHFILGLRRLESGEPVAFRDGDLMERRVFRIAFFVFRAAHDEMPGIAPDQIDAQIAEHDLA